MLFEQTYPNEHHPVLWLTLRMKPDLHPVRVSRKQPGANAFTSASDAAHLLASTRVDNRFRYLPDSIC